jgi:uncharacterized protein YjbJ (UPF0337 family)
MVVVVIAHGRWLRAARARRVGARFHWETTTTGGHVMGEQTDKIAGRAKQAVGAITGDEETKLEGQRQEDKGKLKGRLDAAIDKAHDTLEDLKHKVDRK